MACAVATPLLEPSGDFPAWLEAQGVNAEVAQAMDSELGIRDYGVLRACVGDGLVRAELLATARDRLPFGFYAVLRQVVKALQSNEHHDAGTPRWDDAASSPGDVTLGGLVDVLLALFSGLSRELLLSAQKLGDIDKNGTCAVGSPSATGAETPLDNEIHEMNDYAVNDEGGENSSPDKDDMEPHHTFFPVKSEVDKGRDNSEGHSGFIIEDAFLCKEVGLDVMNVVKVSQIEEQTESHAEVEDKSTVHVTRFIKATEHIPERVEAPSINDRLPNDGQNIFEDNTPLEQQQQQPFSKNTSPPVFLTANVNSGAEKKPYQCSVCNKSFTWNSHLVEHQRIHTGEKPYRCKTCDQSFVQSCHLKTHMRTHTGEKPYLCTTCTRSFSRSHHLKAHQRMHTGQRPFQCKICNHSFSRTGMLKAHERSHTGERPYRCKMCDSSFLRSHHLQVHERTHTGFRPYQCKVCSSSFMRSHHLKVHERMHVGNDSQQ